MANSVKLMLMKMALWDIINGKEQRPQEVVAATTWKKRDKKAQAMIKFELDEVYIRHVDGCATNQETWDQLDTRFGAIAPQHSLLEGGMSGDSDIKQDSCNEKLYYPNSLLCTKPISNYYRSPDMWDSIEFQIHMRTPLEKIAELKDRLQKHIEGLPQYWYPEFRVVCKDIEDSTKMKMAMWMRHHLNYQEGGERFQRRSNLLLYLKQHLEELEISYRLPQQEIMVTGVPLPCDNQKII
ncbi:hypothetical protein L7F22_035636 [Adiantum nelumboides]|nr:hypothetical protein [Adiantum nelumboides]